MTKADERGLVLRDAAVLVVQKVGVEIAPDFWTYNNERIRIAYDSADPNTLEIWTRDEGVEKKVFCIIWQSDGDSIVVHHSFGAWETALKSQATMLAAT
jgi:hypothetical protein